MQSEASQTEKNQILYIKKHVEFRKMEKKRVDEALCKAEEEIQM